MERDRETAGEAPALRPARNSILQRIVKSIIWLIAIIFGGIGLAVGYYALSLDDRMKTTAIQVLEHASLFKVSIGDVKSDMATGTVIAKDIRFLPDWGHIDQVIFRFDPKILKNPGEIHIDDMVLQGGSIRHLGRLGLMPICEERKIIHDPQILNLMIARINWQDVQHPPGKPWPDYMGDGAALNLHVSGSGLCRF